MDAFIVIVYIAESGRKGRVPGVSTRFSPGVDNKRADAAGLDDRTCIARPISQARTETWKTPRLPCSADHARDWQPYPVDAQSAISDDHTYIYIHTVEPVCTFYIGYCNEETGRVHLH